MSKSNPTEIIAQKFILELNEALALENAGIERLQTRVEEISIPEAKAQMQRHLQESLQHQQRLQQMITSLGGEPTDLKLRLPLPSYPDIIVKMMNNSMTKYEWELKRVEYDMIVENAEVTCYLMLIEKAQIAGGEISNMVDPLSLNLRDEQNMVDWIKTNSPAMLTKLWPKIQSSVVASDPSSSTSTSLPTESQ
ncbi:MAG: ferritin-like domain-containing protein [Thermoproteota archaeon]|nr:ferritin-like domain-containing protein [Thermoproteota archaeon]